MTELSKKVQNLMFIETETTPNPATLKFLPGRAVMQSGTSNFTASDQAAHSPLGKRLFAVPGVTGVYLGGDFVTVTKAESEDWFALKPPVLGAIMDHYTAGEAAVENAAEGAAVPAQTSGDPVVSQILELIETRVRPAVAQDGGDITFDSFTDGIVYLHMQGSCAGCPSSTATLKAGIENMLKHYVPEVTEVRAV
jgi:Fe-S cluster biogenesis protein NfuA